MPAMAMQVPVQLMSGSISVLEVMPEMTIGQLKETLKAKSMLKTTGLKPLGFPSLMVCGSVCGCSWNHLVQSILCGKPVGRCHPIPSYSIHEAMFVGQMPLDSPCGVAIDVVSLHPRSLAQVFSRSRVVVRRPLKAPAGPFLNIIPYKSSLIQ